MKRTTLKRIYGVGIATASFALILTFQNCSKISVADVGGAGLVQGTATDTMVNPPGSGGLPVVGGSSAPPAPASDLPTMPSPSMSGGGNPSASPPPVTAASSSPTTTVATSTTSTASTTTTTTATTNTTTTTAPQVGLCVLSCHHSGLDEDGDDEDHDDDGDHDRDSHHDNHHKAVKKMKVVQLASSHGGKPHTICMSHKACETISNSLKSGRRSLRHGEKGHDSSARSAHLVEDKHHECEGVVGDDDIERELDR